MYEHTITMRMDGQHKTRVHEDRIYPTIDINIYIMNMEMYQFE